MAVFSVIKLSELEGAKRIDAEYYKPEYLSLFDRLRKAVCVPAKSVAFPARRKFNPNAKEYFDYIEISEVDLSTGDFNVSKIIGKEAPDRAQWIVNKDDVLVSTVRPIRNAVILIRENKENLVCSSGFAVIHPYKVQANYLFLYFKIPFVAKLLNRHTTATEYPTINWNDVLNTPIYVGREEFQVKISFLIDESFGLLEQSRTLYSQAENLLLEELGLKDFKPKYEKTYTAKLSDTFSAHRIDAEYFQPAYEEVIRKIEDITELKPLGKLANRVKLKINPENNKLYRYIEISDVLIDIGEVNYTERLGKDLPPNARIPVKGGELIISKVRPTRGAIGIIPYCLGEDLICSSAFSVFNVNSPLKEYLYVITRSIIGKLQLEKPTKGTSYPTIEDLDVEKLRIPLLPLSTQQKIASLVQQAHEARRKAKELLEIAKKAVEIAIEKNEEEVLDYLSKTKEIGLAG